MVDRILIVDDEEEIRNLVEASLSGTYEVRTAKNGAEARAIVYEEGYDPQGIVTDYNFPDGPGVDLARELVSSDKTKSLKAVILMSGFDAEVAAKRLGEISNGRSVNTVFLPKPFSPRVLLATVKQNLENKVENSQPTPSI